MQLSVPLFAGLKRRVTESDPRTPAFEFDGIVCCLIYLLASSALSAHLMLDLMRYIINLTLSEL